jgi:hypothetical protein
MAPSVTIESLNGDTTLLVTFHPFASTPSSDPVPGEFSILLDPWLQGPTHTFHPRFSSVSHPSTFDPTITSLAELSSPPALIVISQSKQDHCNEATLRTLCPKSKTTIVSTSDVMGKIRSWKHFRPFQVVTCPIFDPLRRESVYRVNIPSDVPNGAEGEATISFIKPALDMTGLQVAVGITYRPPDTHPKDHGGIYPTLNTLPNPTSISSSGTTVYSVDPSNLSKESSPDPGPAKFDSSGTKDSSSRPSNTYLTTSTAFNSPTLSLLYIPHGIPFSPIHSYATTHLAPLAALPLTALIHSLDRVDNPWLLGGNISSGAIGGLGLANALMPRCWIGTHDAEKDMSGFGTLWVRTTVFGVEDVQALLGDGGKRKDGKDDEDGHGTLKGKTEVVVLGVGEEKRIEL